MEKIAKKITDYVVSGTNLEYEVVKYGVDAILSTGLCFTIALSVCALLGNFLFGVAFIIILTPFKMQFVGYHCKTMFRCIATYSCSVGLLSLAYSYIMEHDIRIFLLCLPVILLLIGLIAQKELNKKTMAYIGIYLIAGIILFYLHYDLFVVLLMAMTYEFILILPKHTKKDTEKCLI